MVDVDLDETLVGGVLVVRVSSNAADSVVCVPCHEGKTHEVDTVRVGVQLLFDLVAHLEIGGGEAQTFLCYALSVDNLRGEADAFDLKIGPPVFQFFVLGSLREVDLVDVGFWLLHDLCVFPILPAISSLVR